MTISDEHFRIAIETFTQKIEYLENQRQAEFNRAEDSAKLISHEVLKENIELKEKLKAAKAEYANMHNSLTTCIKNAHEELDKSDKIAKLDRSHQGLVSRIQVLVYRTNTNYRTNTD
mgnify:CR=1 FL=1